MSPEVIAAIIAAGVSVLTLIGTLAAQYFGRRATSKQLDRTLAEQRTQTLNERFATAAEQLGSEKAAVRLAGIHAMTGLADDWVDNRQTCVDVLCAYLRLPYDPDPGEDADPAARTAYRANREVRRTVIRVITAHLKDGAAVSWQGLNFDFAGVIFDDGADFGQVVFSGGRVSFAEATFSGGTVLFNNAVFSGGEVFFGRARFSGGTVFFGSAAFSGATVYFNDAVFSGSAVLFNVAKFSGGWVDFTRASFSGGEVNFLGARFSGATVYFIATEFSGGEVLFKLAKFSGGEVSFKAAMFSGAWVDFSDAADWSTPPAFPWTDALPPGVKLPRQEDQS